MIMTNNSIVYETPNGKAYVLRIGKGQYEVYENTFTHAVRKAQIGFRNDPMHALQLAKQRALEVAGHGI